MLDIFRIVQWLVFLLTVICAGEIVDQTKGNEEGTCSVLASRISRLEHGLYNAEKLNRKQSSEIDRLKQGIEQLKNLYTNSIITSAGKLVGNASDLYRRGAFRNSRYLLADSTSTLIGFTAYLDHAIDHLGIDQAIVFNRVFYNDGGAYNTRSGIFTCPVSGVYLFFFSVGSGHQRQIVAKLVVNGVTKVGGIADSIYHENHDAQASNMAILRLSSGDLESVENYRWPDKYVQGGHSDHLLRLVAFSCIRQYSEYTKFAFRLCS